MEEKKGADGKSIDPKTRLPESLFLYRKADEFAEQIVREQRLYFSSPLNFNDPFEFLGEDAETTGKKGVLCLSAIQPFDKKSTLMWAHYADKHKGVCFEFDIKHNNDGIIKLYYDDTKCPKIRELKCNIREVKYDIANPCELLTKDEAWEYEDERRIIIDYEDTIKDNNYQRTFIFEPECLKSIYFGVNAKPDTVEKYKSLCAIHMERKIKLYEMKKSGRFLLKEKPKATIY